MSEHEIEIFHKDGPHAKPRKSTPNARSLRNNNNNEFAQQASSSSNWIQSIQLSVVRKQMHKRANKNEKKNTNGERVCDAVAMRLRDGSERTSDSNRF